MILRPVFAAIAVAAALGVALPAQDAKPSVRITSPAEGAPLTGPVRLVAVVDPPAANQLVKDVTFFAGGHKVCTVNRQPFQCEWDAGDKVANIRFASSRGLATAARSWLPSRPRGTATSSP